jgi:hypothetical protein
MWQELDQRVTAGFEVTLLVNLGAGMGAGAVALDVVEPDGSRWQTAVRSDEARHASGSARR